MLANSGDNDKDMTYDDLKTRYTRIRHQLIEQTVDIDINKDDLKALVDNKGIGINSYNSAKVIVGYTPSWLKYADTNKMIDDIMLLFSKGESVLKSTTYKVQSL
jgi:predicted xylose isomerase-like sugar epimerase